MYLLYLVLSVFSTSQRKPKRGCCHYLCSLFSKNADPCSLSPSFMINVQPCSLEPTSGHITESLSSYGSAASPLTPAQSAGFGFADVSNQSGIARADLDLLRRRKRFLRKTISPQSDSLAKSARQFKELHDSVLLILNGRYSTDTQSVPWKSTSCASLILVSTDTQSFAQDSLTF